MNGTEFFELVAKRANLPVSTVRKVFSVAKACTKESVCKGESIMVGGFFSAVLKERPARLCTNPQTGRKFFSQPKKVIALKLSKSFSEV